MPFSTAAAYLTLRICPIQPDTLLLLGAFCSCDSCDFLLLSKAPCVYLKYCLQNQLTAKSHHCFSGKSDLDIVESSLRTPAVSTQTMKLIVSNLSVYLLLFGFIVYSCARVMIYIPPVTKKTTGSLLTLVLLKVSFSCHLRQFLLTLSALETTEHPQTRIIKTCQ